MADTTLPPLYLPTNEACNAYGIPRSGNRSISKTNGLSFLKGPQFNGINIATPPNTNPNTADQTIDEIVLDFIGNQPYKLEFKENNGIQTSSFVTGKDEEPILTVRIAPNTTDWVNMTVKHTWDQPGGLINSLFESVTSLASSATGIITDIRNAGSPIESATAKQVVGVDKADAYQKSDNVEFTIPFLLWSAGSDVDAWIRDVYYPIMLLTAWSHPRRATTITSLADREKVANLGKPSPTPAVTAPANSTDSATIDKQAIEVINGLNKIFPGTRVTILDPPSYIRVKHSSGLFTFNRCVITSFNFKYMDPWINATAKSSSGKLNEATESLLNKSLPMRAECSLTLRSIEKTYADDWISMFEAGVGELGGGSESKVNVNTLHRSPNRSTPTPTTNR